MNTEQIITMLAQDIPLHIDMIDSLQRGIAEIIYANAQGVLLYKFMLYTANKIKLLKSAA